MALLHSLWQAALIWLLFLVFEKLFYRKNYPLDKRNFLFLALATQLSAFFLCFFIYLFYPKHNVDESILGTVAGFLIPEENTYLVTRWIFNAYLLIITYKIFKAIYTWYSFKQHYNKGLFKPGIDLKMFTASNAHLFGIKRKVKLWFSSTINTPVTFGYLKPVILLPLALMNNISVQQAETLILHELTHIKTNDYLLNWFLLVAETLFFFNPFVRLICKNIRLEREKYCDISVMAFEYPAAVYAETLLKAEHIKKRVPHFQLAAVENRSQLLHRIRFFSEKKDFGKKRRFGMITPLISLCLLLLFFSTVLFDSHKINPRAATVNNIQVALSEENTEKNDLVFSNNILKGINTLVAEKLTAKIETQIPYIEKQFKKIRPYIKSLERKAEQIANETEREFAIPVTIRENNAERQIIIKEESSGSLGSSVKVYRLVFDNGQWRIIPVWMATAKEMANDSIGKKTDSTGKRKLLLQ